jgi:hypothetical protein
MTEAKSTHNSGEEWSDEDVQQLSHLAQGNTLVRMISVRLGRAGEAIRSKAQAEGISLCPPNRSPYGDLS